VRPRLTIALLALLAPTGTLQAQENAPATPSSALMNALGAACRQQIAEFSQYLPQESAEAYRNLPQAQQQELMRRLVAVREPGKPLRSTTTDGTPMLRCTSPAETTELRLGRERARGNLAFVPVTVPGGRTAEFGLVREPDGWRLVSVGLLMLNVPELTKEWAAQETVARELRAVAAMRQIAAAAETYRRGFGAVPETLAQLGPSPKEGASPDAANLIDGELAAGAKNNYSFRYRVYSSSRENEARYEIIATPVQYGPGGKRSFYLDSSGVLRGGDKNGDTAGPEDPRLDDRLLEEPG
jgi:type II secretory pathway pseudopilin PulG